MAVSSLSPPDTKKHSPKRWTRCSMGDPFLAAFGLWRGFLGVPANPAEDLGAPKSGEIGARGVHRYDLEDQLASHIQTSIAFKKPPSTALLATCQHQQNSKHGPPQGKKKWHDFQGRRSHKLCKARWPQKFLVDVGWYINNGDQCWSQRQTHTHTHTHTVPTWFLN